MNSNRLLTESRIRENCPFKTFSLNHAITAQKTKIKKTTNSKSINFLIYCGAYFFLNGRTCVLAARVRLTAAFRSEIRECDVCVRYAICNQPVPFRVECALEFSFIIPASI